MSFRVTCQRFLCRPSTLPLSSLSSIARFPSTIIAMLSYSSAILALFFSVTLSSPLASPKIHTLRQRQTLYTNSSFSQSNSNPIVTASFTWNGYCGSTVACGPSAAGVQGTGCSAINTQAYSNGQPIVNGVGNACGQCWHLQPLSDVYPKPNNLAVGTPIVVKINDQCPDGGYCQQSLQAPLNDYGAPYHFDLCAATGTAQAFFGQIPEGVLMGVARFNPDCSGLDDGQFGASMGKLV